MAPIRTASVNPSVVDSKGYFVAFKTLMSIIFRAEYSIAEYSFSIFLPLCSSSYRQTVSLCDQELKNKWKIIVYLGLSAPKNLSLMREH